MKDKAGLKLMKAIGAEALAADESLKPLKAFCRKRRVIIFTDEQAFWDCLGY